MNKDLETKLNELKEIKDKAINEIVKRTKEFFIEEAKKLVPFWKIDTVTWEGKYNSVEGIFINKNSERYESLSETWGVSGLDVRPIYYIFKPNGELLRASGEMNYFGRVVQTGCPNLDANRYYLVEGIEYLAFAEEVLKQIHEHKDEVEKMKRFK